MQLKSQRQRVDLLEDISRGNRSKFLKDQVIPQAGFQKQELIEKHPSLEYDSKNPKGKILIGALGARLIGVEDDRHLMTVAGTRAGKSVAVTSNAFFYDGSMMFNDGKGELANLTSEIRAQKGHKICILDPYFVVDEKVAKYRRMYNPVKTLSLDNIDVIEDAHNILEGIIIESANTKDPHWDEQAKNTLLGLLLYVAFGSNIAEKERTLGKVRDLLNMILRQEVAQKPDGTEFTRYVLIPKIKTGIEHLKENHAHVANAIEASIRGIYDMSDRERSSVISSTKRHTAFLDFKPIRDVMDGHDFDLEGLKREKVTVYLVLPQRHAKSCKRWTRLFYTLLPAAIEREKAKPDVPVLAVIDEFPSLGRMAELEESVGRMAGHGLKFWFVLQDWSQGEAIYGKRWESFAANCGCTIFFGNVDLTTTEYVSKRLGKTPVVSVRLQDSTYPRRSHINYVHDNFYESLAIEAEVNELDHIQNKWLERASTGCRNGTTGEHVFTRPPPIRTTIVMDKLKQDDYLPQIGLRDHTGDIVTAVNTAKDFKYDQLGSPRLLRANFRGLFLNENPQDNSTKFVVIILLGFPGEELFRTREFEFCVEGNGAGEVMENVENAVVELTDCHDGFANFGAEYGRMWHGVSMESHSHLDDFAWMSKGRRCIRFTRCSAMGKGGYADVFHLVRYPAQVELALNLLYACP